MANPYNGIKFLNQNTAQQIGQTQQGYQPAQQTQQAMQTLANTQNARPASFAPAQNGNYQQAANLTGQLNNRLQQGWQYNVNSDKLYQQAKQQYNQHGIQAARQTIANLNGMNSGLGNTYADPAAMQGYQQYLTRFNNGLEDFENAAYGTWAGENRDLGNLAGLYNKQYVNDAAAYQQNMQAWNQDRAAALKEYGDQYNRDYGEFGDNRSYWQNVGQAENKAGNVDRQYAYTQALEILQNGGVPDDSVLAAAGISKADAQAMADSYRHQKELEFELQRQKIAQYYKPETTKGRSGGRGPKKTKASDDKKGNKPKKEIEFGEYIGASSNMTGTRVWDPINQAYDFAAPTPDWMKRR